MLLLAALFLAIAPQDVGTERREAIIARCRIARSRLAVYTQDDGLGYGVMVKGSGPLSNAQLRCYSGALAGETGVYPIFENDALGKRYTLLIARDVLRQAGVLDRLPVFRPRRETLAAFALRLERLCHAKPHSTLEAVGDNIQFTETVPDTDDPNDFRYRHCAVNAAIVSGYEVFGPMPMQVVYLPEPVPPPAR